MADVVSDDVISNRKRNHHGNDKEEESKGQMQEEGSNYGNRKRAGHTNGSHNNSPASYRSNQKDADVPEEEAGDNTEAEGWGSSHEVTPSSSPVVLGGAPAVAPSSHTGPSSPPGLAIPAGLAPLALPEHSTYTPRAAPNTPIPFNHHDDTDSPSLATGGGHHGNLDPPIIIGPDDDDGVRYRGSAPAPIYPLALEIPRISEPEPMDMYDGHRTSASSDIESGLRSRSSLQGLGHSRHGSDLSSAVSTPHSPVRFKEPITDESPCPDPSPDGDGADPGTAPAEEDLLFPGYVPVVFRCLTQTTQPRYYCLKTITWPYPF